MLTAAWGPRWGRRAATHANGHGRWKRVRCHHWLRTGNCGEICLHRVTTGVRRNAICLHRVLVRQRRNMQQQWRAFHCSVPPLREPRLHNWCNVRRKTHGGRNGCTCRLPRELHLHNTAACKPPTLFVCLCSCTLVFPASRGNATIAEREPVQDMRAQTGWMPNMLAFAASGWCVTGVTLHSQRC